MFAIDSSDNALSGDAGGVSLAIADIVVGSFTGGFVICIVSAGNASAPGGSPTDASGILGLINADILEMWATRGSAVVDAAFCTMSAASLTDTSVFVSAACADWTVLFAGFPGS